MRSAWIQAQAQNRGSRRRVPVGAIELLNRHWRNLRGGPSPRPCPGCAANVSAGEYAVHHGGELYHPDCAPEPRPSPDADVRPGHPRGGAAKLYGVALSGMARPPRRW